MAFERLFSNLLREIYAVFCKIRRLRLFGLRTITIFWFILSPYALNDIRFEILFIWYRTSRCSVSCSSSLGKLLLLSQRASAAAPRRSSSLSELLLLLLSQWAAAAAPLSASCESSLGELQLLSQRTATPLGKLLLSSEAALLVYYSLYEMLRQTTVIQMLWCYCDINIFLKIPIVL